MINIILAFDKSNRLIELKSKGHADYNNSGKDIVCSAVSVYIINTINTLTKIVKVEEFIDFKMDSGYVDLHINYEGMTNKEIESTLLILDSLKLALESINESYEKYISVEYKEVR